MSGRPAGRAPGRLRTRFAVAIAAVSAVTLVAALAIGYVLTRGVLYDGVDSALVRDATAATRAYEERGWVPPSDQCRFLAAPACVAVVRADGSSDGPLAVLPAYRDVASGASDRVFEHTEIDSHPARALAVPLDDGEALVLAVRSDQVETSLARIRLAFSALAVVAVLLGSAAAWLVARRGLRPVTALAADIRAAGDDRTTGRRVPDPGLDELQPLASAFNAVLDRVDDAERAQRQLLQNTAHELRTPMTAIRANVQLLVDERLPDAGRPLLADAVTAGVDEMVGIIDDVVDIARGEDRQLDAERIDLAVVVEAGVAAARAHWPAAGISCTVEPAWIVGDSARLHRLLGNLADNAVAYSAEPVPTTDGAGAAVEVRLVARDGAVELMVADDGPGFAADLLGSAFERFHRSVSVQSIPGSGLGLAIVGQIAAAHGATVVAENRDPVGAIVRVSFPAAP